MFSKELGKQVGIVVAGTVVGVPLGNFAQYLATKTWRFIAGGVVNMMADKKVPVEGDKKAA
jgi:F0F1-type ATP synthase assembly protein I